MTYLRLLLKRLMLSEDREFGAAVFSLALALRLSFLAFWLWRGLAARYGQDLYYSLALHWLGWGPWEGADATHPPLYTAFIAGILWCFGRPKSLPVLLLQAVLSSLAPLLVGRIGERLASRRAGRLAALWTALDPGLIFYTPQLQTETLFVFMELAFFLWLYRCLSTPPRPAGFAVAGFLGGLCALCRSVFAAYPVALGLALVWMRGGRKILWPFALFSIGWLSPIGAWTCRNWVKYHAVIPISAQMGWTLYEGFTLDREEIRRRPYEMAEEARRLGISDPLEAGRYFKEKTLRLAREQPLKAAGIVVGKALLYWRPWPYDPYSPIERTGLAFYFTGLFFLAGVGVWSSRGAWREWLPLYALFAYLTAMHAVFFTSLRYRMPLEPFLCLLAAVGLNFLLGEAPAGTGGTGHD